MSDITLIQNRVREVTLQIERHRVEIERLEKELVDLQTAARVLTGLMGASGDSPSEEDASEPQETGGGKPAGTPSIPEMIREVMRDATIPLEPKQVAEAIRERWWPEMKSDRVSSIMWRMLKRGDLVRMPETSQYELPFVAEADDANPSGDTSSAPFLNHEADDREAGPGGGG